MGERKLIKLEPSPHMLWRVRRGSIREHSVISQFVLLVTVMAKANDAFDLILMNSPLTPPLRSRLMGGITLRGIPVTDASNLKSNCVSDGCSADK